MLVSGNKVMEFDTEIERAVQQLRNEKQIASKEFLNLIGNTTNDTSVWFPDSYQRGYQDALTSINERPKMLWNLLGLVGYFSDGHFNYLPTYNQGFHYAEELKTNVIAHQTMKLTEKSTKQENEIKNLNATVDRLTREVDELKKEKKSES